MRLECTADPRARRGALPEARSPAADRVVQDPRRLQRRPPADARAARRRRLDGQRGQRGAGRRARGAPGRRALLGDGDGHGAATRRSARSSGSARRIVRASYDECWRTVESHGSDRMTGHFVHPFDDDRFIAGNGDGGARDSRGPARTWTRSSRRSAAAGCCRASPRRSRGLKPRHPGLRRRTGDRGAAGGVAGRRTAGLFRRLDRRRSSTAPAASRCWRRCGRCSRRSPGRSWSRWMKSRGAMRLVAERAHVIAEGAAGCAVAAALSGGAGRHAAAAARSSRSSPAATSTCATFAALVGALQSHRIDEPIFEPSALSRSASPASTSSPSTSGGAGTPRRATVFRRLDYTLVARDRAQPGADAAADPARASSKRRRPIRTFLRALRSRRSPALDDARGGAQHLVVAQLPAPRGPRSPTSPPSSRCISRCRSTPAASACSPAITARKRATSACRSSASASCIRRATSTSTCRPTAGRRRATSG